ncbi:TPA: hypothetical protein N0F65_011520 [Lagenidium giganteum]|uniref:Very long-chain fatty acid transport protein n=1 Tax=Lagenidium giganteum TaxID=4803 RepID=A0AAV2Z7M6_9STRA|nr:TPA: hypothetical protein N0F65_011520 [Lagenidium giganteum]
MKLPSPGLADLATMDALQALPKKFLAVATAAAAGYYLDSKLLLTSDLRRGGVLALGLLQAKYYARNGVLVPDLFEDAVRQWPHKPCMRFEDRTLSFAEVDAAANRVAQWALGQGMKPGETVALLMENRPEFVIVWMGLAKVGVVAALINTHIQADGLVHCVRVAECHRLIVGEELLERLASVVAQLPTITCYVYGNGVLPWSAPEANFFAKSLDAELALMSPLQPPSSIRRVLKTTDMALLIYTSGTTGLPKAARVNHFSIINRSISFKVAMNVTVYDRIYCALPLYHTSGGNLAVGTMFLSGATLCISRRFSTSRFWDEVRQFDCTIIQYIGEMCRYLLNAPPKDNDRQNHVRAAFGNALRPDVWAPFQKRFGVPAVYEFYGSTEGVMGMINSCTTPQDQGHLGRRGYLQRLITGTVIVRYDVEKDEYVRTPQGYLQECDVDEVGELICQLKPSDPAKSFEGYYKNEKESSKKVLRNVFKEGDMYFRTGDLFKRDANHCWHFMDRIGDTFRWKGENVATGEVAQALSDFPGLSDICVYGVEVPGNEGRACMAAMVFDAQSFDMKAFAQHVTARLPSFAVPLFLRQLPEMSVTGTMKHEKAKLRKEGMDPSRVQDALWCFNKAAGTYERLTTENHHRLVTSSRL